MIYAVVEMIDNNGPELCSVYLRSTKQKAVKLAMVMVGEQLPADRDAVIVERAKARLREAGSVALGTWAVTIKKVEDE